MQCAVRVQASAVTVDSLKETATLLELKASFISRTKRNVCIIVLQPQAKMYPEAGDYNIPAMSTEALDSS